MIDSDDEMQDKKKQINEKQAYTEETAKKDEDEAVKKKVDIQNIDIEKTEVELKKEMEELKKMKEKLKESEKKVASLQKAKNLAVKQQRNQQLQGSSSGNRGAHHHRAGRYVQAQRKWIDIKSRKAAYKMVYELAKEDFANEYRNQNKGWQH